MNFFQGVFTSEPQTPSIWTKDPSFFYPFGDYVTGEELYNKQLDSLASALIVSDYDPNIQVDECNINTATNIKFPQGALLSGSFVMHYVASHLGGVNLKYDDVDIYFHSKEHAEEFLKLNYMYGFSNAENPMCRYGTSDGIKYNLIYGVEFTTPKSLISRFDIRACSMAIDPNANILYLVNGAAQDATRKNLVFNPVPRAVSMRRVEKYIQKGFSMEKHQRVFLVELLKTHLYSIDLELMTKEY
jgi:hypothetical protein